MKVVNIKPCSNVAQSLRNIADKFDSGELSGEATLICGTEVFHFGCFDDSQAVVNALFHMNVGIQKLVNAALK